MNRTHRIQVFGRRTLSILSIICGWCVTPCTAQANAVTDLFSRSGEQRATFEGFQVNRRFFNCIAEAANANQAPDAESSTLAESSTCLRSLLTQDAALDNDGVMISG